MPQRHSQLKSKEVAYVGTCTLLTYEAKSQADKCYHGDWGVNQYAYLMRDLLLVPCVGGDIPPLGLSCLDVIRIEGVHCDIINRQFLHTYAYFCYMCHHHERQ